MQFNRRDFKVFGDLKPKDNAEKDVKKDRFVTIFPPALDFDNFKFDEMIDDPKKKSPTTTMGPLDPSSSAAATLPPRSLRRQSSMKANTPKNNNSDAYLVRTTKNAHMMKSEDDRKSILDLAVARKKDRKEDEKINRRRSSVLGGGGAPESPTNSSFTRNDSFISDNNNMEGEDQFDPENDYGLGLESAETANDDMKDVYERYIGESAIIEFQQKYKKVLREMEKYPEEADIPPENVDSLTPRSLYLRGTIKNKGLPLSSLLLRKENEPLGIFLAHYGLGDTRLQPLVRVIDSLPGIKTLDLADNRLTDLTLLPLTAKLASIRNLTHLDLSFNKIDESSKSLRDYLVREDCTLKLLLLDGADVDDGECRALASAVTKNRSLRTLSLAKNFIGKAELLNVLHPELITGGEALGVMLKENKTLTKLDLSWNSIRLDSAIALAESLESNDSLKVLNLGYNSFGDMPSQILAKALKTNKSLQELDLESNSLNPKAATVLANAISFNETLLKLNISGNTLGKIGAQALVAAIQRSSTETRKLQVSFVNCDCNREDDNIFSAANPHGTWRMNLKEPYGQMVATECFYLANHKAGCRIVKLFYNGQLITLERAYVARADEGAAGIAKKNKLEEFFKFSRQAANMLLEENFEESSVALNNLLKLFGFNMTDDQRLTVVRKTLDLWTVKAKREGRDDLQEVFLYEIFFSLFVINDTDMSGTMDLDEFMETLASLGKTDYDRDAAKRLMSDYDRDESGTMDANEFGNIMLNEFCRTEIPRGELVDPATGQPWVIPTSGNCVIQLSYQCDVPTLYDVGADHGLDNIIKSIREAKTDDQREILFQNTTSSPYFFLSFDQAQLLFEEMQILNRLPLDLMASILPQIVNEEQAIKFIDTNLNETGKFHFRLKIGPLYGAFVGLRTGHYAIDLKVANQRNSARRLGAISVTEGKMCRQAGVTSSQKGNYSNFRNEKLGLTPLEVTARFFASATSQQNTKVLRCDYVSTDKARKGTPIMSESRFEKLLQQLNLEEIRKVWNRLSDKETRHFEMANQLTNRSERTFSASSSLQEDEDLESLCSEYEVMAAQQLQQQQQQKQSSFLPAIVLQQQPSLPVLQQQSSQPRDVNNSSNANSGVNSATNSVSGGGGGATVNSRSSMRRRLYGGGGHDKYKTDVILLTNAGYQIDFHDFPELFMEAPYTVSDSSFFVLLFIRFIHLFIL
jgi:hypothetical protein